MASTARFDLGPGVTEPVVPMISRRRVEQRDVASVLKELKPLQRDLLPETPSTTKKYA